MRASEFQPKKLVIFDIDDTLVHTQTKVHVIKNGQVTKELNSHEFTHYKLQPGETFDFENFKNAYDFFHKSKPIIPMLNQLKQDIATGNKVVMVTARSDFDDRELFLDTFRKYGIDMSKVHVYRAGNNTAKIQTEEKKKIIIRNLLDNGNYTKAIMYDDAVPNLTSFVELKQEYPQTKFYAWHVSLEGEATEFHRTNESLLELDVKKTFGFVKKAHAGQQYGNAPYWTHPRKVAAMGRKIFGAKFNNDAVKVAFLHDVVEDTKYTLDQIARMGYSQEVVDAVRLLTKNKNLTYKENIKAIIASGNKLAIMVKYADNYANYTGDKSTWEPSKAASSQKKYKSSMDMLGDKLKTTKHQELEPAELDENFADGKKPGRKGLAKRSGVNCKASISTLRNVAKNSSGEKQRMAHWCANMKSGKQ